MRRVGVEDLCSVLDFAARWEAIWLNLPCAALRCVSRVILGSLPLSIDATRWRVTVGIDAPYRDHVALYLI
ncbi:hypothetical protein A6U94_18855 [Agrobacterium tumefaciens]|nr:hypothetical protein A6U94_18855 [Agrobacterium tumefaciens]